MYNLFSICLGFHLFSVVYVSDIKNSRDDKIAFLTFLDYY